MTYTKIVVCNENVFGYIDHDAPDTFYHLSGLLSEGAASGVEAVTNAFKAFASIRLATSADFQKFRIKEDGYRNDPSFIYKRAA